MVAVIKGRIADITDPIATLYFLFMGAAFFLLETKSITEMALLFGSTVINYINRQTLSVLAPVVMQRFHMTHADYSYVVSAFQIAYAGMWLVGGVIIDVIGTRRALTLAMIWWSLSSMLHSLAGSIFSLAAFRFMLGIGEGFNWPGASKTVAEWFPAMCASSGNYTR